MMRLKIGQRVLWATSSGANCNSGAAPFDAIPSMLHLQRVEGSPGTESLEMKREHGRRSSRAEAEAAPATVGGEPHSGIDHWETGKVRKKATTREPGDLPSTLTGLMSERGRLGLAEPARPETPKALTRNVGQSASEGS